MYSAVQRTREKYSTIETGKRHEEKKAQKSTRNSISLYIHI